MKNAKNRSQKGFSLIAIVITVIAVVAILAVVTMYLPKNSQQSSTQQTNASQNDQTLDKIEDQAYTFYFPTGYVKGQADPDISLFYQNPKSAVLGVVALKILTSKSRLGNPSYEFCKRAGEAERERADDEIEAQTDVSHVTAEPIKTNGIGCKIIRKSKLISTKVSDTRVGVERQLWSNENSTTAYVIAGLYYESAPQSEKDKITEAVEAFALR